VVEEIKVKAGVLSQAVRVYGPKDGTPVFLMHGFPYDALSCHEAAVILAGDGCRVYVPSLRGFGATRFLDAATCRSGQQAALAADLLALMNALSVPRAVLAGYDWGGRAACILAALYPQHVAGLVSCGVGYNIQNIAKSSVPSDPAEEARNWYQYYFHGARGRAGLTANRADLCRLLWRMWSPTWGFDPMDYAASAPSFDNPDFVDVVIHSYRHRYGLVAGDPAYAEIEEKLAGQPAIPVPSIVLLGQDDGVTPPVMLDPAAAKFTGPYQRRLVPGAGHNLPQEKPAVFAGAVRHLVAGLI